MDENTSLPIPLAEKSATATVFAKPGAPADIEVMATAPDEMIQAQSNMLEWARRKVSSAQEDEAELKAAFEHAFKHKWKAGVLKRHWEKAQKRTQFFIKFYAALEAGYIVVPNFPVRLFLIRTANRKPLRAVAIDRWATNHEQQAKGLPQGQGEYQNPFPIVWTRAVPKPTSADQNATAQEHWAQGWDEIEFPINMAKPQIMEAATRAMALNVFDEFGVLPSPYVKEDPMIVGRLIQPAYDRRRVSFLIAWHFNSRDL